MKMTINVRGKLKLLVAAMLFFPATYCCSSCTAGGPNQPDNPDNPDNSDNPGTDPVPEKMDYELSYWVDMDVIGGHLRGYWYDVQSSEPIETTPASYIENACRKLRNDYGATKLYVVYHRQYELASARSVFRVWKQQGAANDIEIVPTVVLQSYSAAQSMNFTDEEIRDLAKWCTEEINPDAFGIYDVYTRDRQGQPQAAQLSDIRRFIGNKLVMVGMQPGVTINPDYLYAVQDTWTAECQGRTNELWENPVYLNGTNVYGRKLLETWVAERRDNESRKVVWNMIPVAWDYETDDPLSYVCPGDDQYKNDPPIPGRIGLCHDYITKWYDGGLDNERFGGYSCDLHILQANSGGRGEEPSFYKALRQNTSYTGDFAATMREIGDLYKSLQPEPGKNQSMPADNTKQ